MHGKRGFDQPETHRCISFEVMEGDKQEGRKGGCFGAS
jgi:hypothetical protein